MKHCVIISFLIVSLSVKAQSNTIDSLINIVETTSNDTIKVKALYEWDGLIYISDPQLDNQINLQIVDITTRNLNETSSLSKEETFFYKSYLSLAYNVLGINEDDNGNYPPALDYYYKSLELAEELKDSGTIGGVYNNIGLIHEKLNNFELAQEFYSQSLILELNTDDQDGIVTAYNNIGSVYLAQNKLDSTLHFYKKALSIAQTESEDYQLASTLGNIGVAYEQLDNFDSSLFYYNSSLEVRERINDWDGLSNVLSNIGLIYVQKKDANTALKHCRRGFRIAVKNKGTFRTMLNCNCLYQSFKLNNNSDSALYYHELLDTLNGKLTNEDNNRLVAQKDIIYQHEKEVYKDSLNHAGELQLSKETLEKTKAQDQLRITLLASGLITLALIGLIIYFRLAVARKQKLKIEKQHRINSLQKLEIEQSIGYAKLIQESTLPTLNHDDIFKDSFIYYNPKEAVSGDFYWLEEDNTRKYFSVADCTGHGIPGAFISMIGTILLNEIYNSKKITSPDLVLNELNRLMELTLDSGDHHMKDGMDIAFCTLDKVTNILSYSAANNPVWILSKMDTLSLIQDGSPTDIASKMQLNGNYLFEIKANKQPIGKGYGETKKFTLSRTQLKTGDKVFIFTDGFADQFGGEKGKKYKYKPFKQLLLTHANEPMDVLNKKLAHEFRIWKGDLEQIDDVCIMGVEV